jgi:hypothetical protein
LLILRIGEDWEGNEESRKVTLERRGCTPCAC